MDWVHCNSCAVQPNEDNRKLLFRLTSCGHIFCQNCLKTDSVDACQYCKVKDVTTIQLSTQMKPEIKMYFDDPQDLLTQLTKTIEFQRGHRMRFTQLIKHKVEKYNRAKVYIGKLEQKLKQEMEIRGKLTNKLQLAIREIEMLRGNGAVSSQNSQYSSSSRIMEKPVMRGHGIPRSVADMSPFSMCSSQVEGYHSGRYRDQAVTKESINMTPSSNISQSPYTPVNSNYILRLH
ncbi:zip homologous protein 3 isoform X2 [Nilaparvata lugens]|uniref:zip homologous protein 3 isoform X2 n=1 Tax=Nilaparvata lugens TaxID=108931 RepID=UPI000B99A5D1|nr:zip homologous protein 3 isoform X2 [Nilaparvata lugens]